MVSPFYIYLRHCPADITFCRHPVFGYPANITKYSTLFPVTNRANTATPDLNAATDPRKS